MMHVYIVGPCGAGKTTYGKILNLVSVDDLAAQSEPELYSRKPWRWWSRKEGSRKLALEWETVQQRIFQKLLPDQCAIISHVGAFLGAELPEGITFILEPHESESEIQRMGDLDLQEITRTSQLHWRQVQRQLCLDKAIKLGTVVDVPSFVRVIDVVRHIEYAILKCYEMDSKLEDMETKLLPGGFNL